MKLFFKITILFALLGPATESFASYTHIILVTYDQEIELAQHAKNFLNSQFNIPDELVQMTWQSTPCQNTEESILQICIKNDGTLDFPVMKSEILNRSFRIFKKKLEE